MPRPEQQFVVAVATMFIATLTAASALVAAVDPYWLWRENVSWQGNPAMETRMRFAKSLQALSRQADVVMLGSSVVYRGMNPADVAGLRAYNLGISSLRIREAEAYVHHLIRWAKPAQIVLGVDYFAFDRLRPTESGFDPTLAEAGYVVKAGLGAFISRTAMEDAWRLLHKPTVDPDGTWHRNGYKHTRPRTPEEISAILKMTREFFEATSVERSELEAIARIAELTRRANVKLLLFIPPYHRSWINTVRASVRGGLSFDDWMAALAALARAHRVELWDFATANPYAQAPVGIGSAYYLDPSHFSPLLGRWILHRLGLPIVSNGEAPPKNFGARLSSSEGH
jgi:hypothetical protein